MPQVTLPRRLRPAAGRGDGANALRHLSALGQAQRRAVRIVACLPLRRLGLALLTPTTSATSGPRLLGRVGPAVDARDGGRVGRGRCEGPGESA